MLCVVVATTRPRHGGDVNTILRLAPRPKETALLAWQFIGQPVHEWPAWVRNVCSLGRGPAGRLELRHERRSGCQVVHLDEWLVKDLDGGVNFYTDDELRASFQALPE